jgi:transcriptional regulator with XRE-family HTH domain
LKSPVTNQILQIIRTYAYKENITMSEFGRKANVSKAWLSKLKNTDANLSVETADKLLSAAGYKINIVKKNTASVESKIEKVAIKEISNKIFKKMLKI